MSTQNPIYIDIQFVEAGLKDDVCKYVKNNSEGNNIYRVTKGNGIVIDLIVEHWAGLYDDVTNFPLTTTFQRIKSDIIQVHVADMILTIKK